MKLSVSNIAWENKNLEEHLELLKDLKCDGVEIAPSCIWKEPANVKNEEAKELRKLVYKYNLSIPALHALLFTRPDLGLFGDEAARKKTSNYLKKIISLAEMLDAKILVYGSPKSRRMGDKKYSECYSMALEIFKGVGDEAEKRGRIFCIEPLGTSECEFIQNSDEGFNLVKDVASPGFGLHLDAKAMIDSREDFGSVFQKYGKVVKHFHAGDPGIAPPGYTGFDHSVIGRAMKNSGYQGFLSIEMKREFGETKAMVKNAVGYVRKNYFLNT